MIRTAIKCIQQNGIVERFNRTLTNELLNAVIPINERHLNRLLREFKQFYNTARPHRANGGEAPEQIDACNEGSFEQGDCPIESIAWLGGLHHSYRQGA
ncbi:integrase core domain-containing protein [Vreelandella lionensis]|uniref:integrase core domain-containing protein n=1 Tax=Vreelandella lionensis TaxID=1144478 RepID=UPI001A9E198F|nr:integrase core domain-containing protein [Halomonas lionensis]